jgi:hypothetical protein
VDANAYFSRPAPAVARGVEILEQILAQRPAAAGAALRSG